jgi:addiction module HigA family antidote
MTNDSPTIRYERREVSAPGATLLDLLDERGITLAELAPRVGLTRTTVDCIVEGTEPISAATALQLEHALGVPVDFWLTRDAHYREHLARYAATKRTGA